MLTNLDDLQTAVNIFSKTLLEDPDPEIRAKMAEVLGKLGSKAALPALYQAFQTEKEITIRCLIADIIVIILKPQSVENMSETPKYNFPNAQIVQIVERTDGGDVKAHQTD